jgi:ADP-heptose:LPS heptosyltransferase
MEDLLAVIHSSSAVVAPSTGVLHIAASLGKPSFGLFSPIAPHHPRRWGPRGPVTEVFLPEVNGLSPSEIEMLDNSYMTKISAEQVFSKLEKYLS